MQYVIGFAKMCIVRTIVNSQKYNFEIFNSLYLRNASGYMCTILHESTVTHASSLNQLFNELFVELSTIFINTQTLL